MNLEMVFHNIKPFLQALMVSSLQPLLSASSNESRFLQPPLSTTSSVEMLRTSSSSDSSPSYSTIRPRRQTSDFLSYAVGSLGRNIFNFEAKLHFYNFEIGNKYFNKKLRQWITNN